MSKLPGMDIKEIRRANLRAWVAVHGTPQKEKSYFSQLLSGLSSFGERSARRLERDYKMGEFYLDAAQDIDSALGSEGKVPRLRTPFRKVEAVADGQEIPGVVRIRRVKLHLSAGICGFAADVIEEDDNPIFFREDWLEKRGYRRESLIAIPVRGQSMEPNLYEGDTVVINTAESALNDGEVYAVNYEGEAVIKRLVREIGFWWLVSDNPDQRRYPKKQCEGDGCLIIGKVVHRQTERI